MVAGFATSCTAASEVGLPVKAVVATGGALAAGEGSGLSSLALVASVRGRSRRRLLLESASQDLVHEGDGHPGVGSTVPVNGGNGTYTLSTKNSVINALAGWRGFMVLMIINF